MGTLSFHHGNTDYYALIRNQSQKLYMSLPNTNGKRNGLRNTAWETKSLKPCDPAEPWDGQPWQVQFNHTGEQHTRPFWDLCVP